MMACPRAACVIRRYLKTDVVWTIKQVQGTERRFWVGRIENDRYDLAETVSERHGIGLVPTGLLHDSNQMLAVLCDDSQVDRIGGPAVSRRDVDRDMIRPRKNVKQSHEVRYDDICHQTVDNEQSDKNRGTAVGIRPRRGRKEQQGGDAKQKNQRAPQQT